MFVWLIRHTTPESRIWFSEALIWVCLVGCPYTMLTTNEPPWILLLSWGALLFTAIDIIVNTDIRKEVD